MADVLVSQTFQFQSGSGTSAWTFSVVVDSGGNYTIQNIQSPTGPFRFDSGPPMPESVTTDMNTAIELVRGGGVSPSGSTGSTGSSGFTVLVALFSLCGWYSYLLSDLS